MKTVAGENAAGTDNDGVTISINTASGKLFSKLTSLTEKETIETTVNVMLKGESDDLFCS